MPKRKHITLVALLIILTAAMPVAAQNSNQQIDLADGDTIDILLCREGDGVTISAWSRTVLPLDAVVRVSANGSINISTNIQVGFTDETADYPYPDYIRIVDDNSVLLNITSGYIQQSFTNLQGSVEIHVHFDSLESYQPNILRRAYFFVSVADDSCSSLFWGMTADHFGMDTAVVSFWSIDSVALLSLDSGEAVPIMVDPTTRFGQAVLHNLLPENHHTITLTTPADSANHCCRTTLEIDTPPHVTSVHGCIDATDIYADYVVCAAGKVNTPASYGPIDSGIYVGSPSRHTVVTDTTATDPCIGPQLRMVCPGCSSSVRLGNTQVGGEWESVTYAMDVDTNLNPILILKYATILENPNHPYSQQPHFRFDLFDNNMEPVPEECGHALFVAGDSNNWNQAGAVQWKNWTTVGFDLSPYHGQTLRLRFYNSDCSQGGHFGYSYYTTQCSRKRIRAEQCGPVDSNTFTAPDGFIYSWANGSGAIISTARSITVPNDSCFYRCILTSPENSNCKFSLSAFTGTRLPVAQASVSSVTTANCHDFKVDFHNTSHVNHSPNERPDEVMWIFSDGDTTYDYNPIHIFHDTGSVTATLIAGLCGWQCTDTTVLSIRLMPYYEHENLISVCDSLRWLDSATYYTDTVGPSLLFAHPGTCDTLERLNLTVNHSYSVPPMHQIICRHSSFSWHGQYLIPPHTADSLTLTDTLSAVNGCDSVLSLRLHIKPTVDTDPQHDTACMGENYHWRNIVVNDSLSQQLLHDTVIGIDGCDTALALLLTRRPQLHIAIGEEHDCNTAIYLLTAIGDTAATLRWSNGSSASNIFATPTSSTTYHLTAGYSDSLLCAVSDSILLRPIVIPTAMLKVVPERLTYDHPDFTAYDITGEDYLRQWIIVHHDGDSLHLASDARQVTHTANPSDDSLQVVLAVSNGLCPDTARATVTMLYTTFFAPNVFTPELDINNRFAIVGHGLQQLELEIYNRNGECIFRTADASSGWDGTCGGRPSPQGAYVWRLSYIAADRPTVTRTAIGTVTLLR